MATKKAGILAGLAVAALAITGVVASTGTAFADPTTNPTGTPAASADGTGRMWGRGGGGLAGVAGHEHTVITGDEAQKVIDAVKAKDADVTIAVVTKDPDGSYDARGSKADGSRIMYEVSGDLKTVTACPADGTGMPGEPRGGRNGQAGKGRMGGMGGAQHTIVTGDEAQKVTDAVKAKYPDVTIVAIAKDADGSYDARTTKADGTHQMYNVSADLKDITEGVGGMGRGPRR